MKQLLLLFIKVYWFVIPPSKRKHCLFKKSCSTHVYQHTKEQGLVQGAKAFWFRFKNCRPGYHLIPVRNETIMVSGNKTVFSENEINPRILLKNM